MVKSFAVPFKWIILHILLAFLAVYLPVSAKLWCIFTFFGGFYLIVKNKNQHEEAILSCAYFVALEVLLRICNAQVLGYEMAKYAIVIFLLLGNMFKQRAKSNQIWLIAIALLIPSILITKHFESARFSTSGIISLLFAAYYFQGKVVDRYFFLKLMSVILLPIISMAIIITLKTPDYSTIEFTANSNAEMSGGLAPIHVSTCLSIGLLIAIMLTLLNQSVFSIKWIDYAVIFLLLFRVIFTFARSGLFALIISLSGFLLCYMASRGIKKHKSIFRAIIIGFVGVIAWITIANITGGMSINRYTGRDTYGERSEDVTTGRGDLFEQDIDIFLHNPVLGVGAGNVAEYRISHYGRPHTSHTEYSRLLAEHGLFGAIVLLILIIEPIKHFRITKGWTRLFFIAFVLFTLTNIIPGSTRTALPMFIYGLAFIRIKEDYSPYE